MFDEYVIECDGCGRDAYVCGEYGPDDVPAARCDDCQDHDADPEIYNACFAR